MINLKLPNFFDDKSFNTLKMKMGIDKFTYGNFGNSQSIGTRIQLETKGIDVENVAEISPLKDHTLIYKGERVILYIRDVSDWGNEDRLPKFHIALCSTLNNMLENGKKKRYVVSQNESKIFHLNLISGRSVRELQQPLDVCRNCLEILRWEDYSKTWSQTAKDNCVKSFEISDFFVKYPKAPIQNDGYSDRNSAINQYPDNWNIISYNYRKSKNWICEQCGVNLTTHKSLLQTHHINSQKNDCRLSNLKALCVDCHTHQPMHSHMNNNPNNQRQIQEIKAIRRQQGIN